MHWISREALFGSAMLPFRISTDLLLWPVGGMLHSSDPIGSLLSLPLQPLFGLVASYNLLVLAYLTFSATAMFTLARRVTGDTPAAAVGGLAFGFSPFLLAEVNNGSPELLTAGWLPLLVLALSRVAITRGRTGILPAAAALCMASLSTWYYGVCACLIVVVHALFPLRLHAKPPLPMPNRLGRHAAVLVVFAVATAPFLALYLDSMSGPSALVYGGAMHRFHALTLPQLSVDAGALLLPRDASMGALDFRLPSYLGLVLAALAIYGAVVRREGRRFWLLAGLASLVLALGPILVFRGQQVIVAGHPLWMPFALISEVVPQLGSLHFPRRLLIGALMAAALLGAVGIQALARRVPARWSPAVAGVCAILLVADLLLARQVPLPLPTTDAVSSPVFQTLAASPLEGAVLEAPVMTGGNRLSILFAQTVHGRPIQSGIPTWEDPSLAYCAAPLSDLQLVQWLAETGKPGARAGSSEAPSLVRAFRDIEWLTALSFTHILIHEDEYTPTKATEATDLLDRVVGPGDRTAPSFVLYTLPPIDAT